MTYDDLMRKVFDSTPEDWQRIEIPLPNPYANGEDDLGIFLSAVFLDNVDITLAWGFADSDSFDEDWAKNFADQTARKAYVHIRYRGVPIDQRTAVSVDGGRCFILLPRLLSEREICHEIPFKYRLPAGELKFARVIYYLTDVIGRPFEEVLNEAEVEFIDYDTVE